MARTARRFDLEQNDASLVQASFDFLPEEARRRHRFGSVAAADRAERRARLKLIDAQVAGLGSRIAAARLREILKPADPAPTVSSEFVSADALVAARTELREIGSAIFYFRNGEEMSQEPKNAQQRLHPRPLPPRYYDR
jgi:hypothetical protein